jgi:hypothetical protein
MPTGEGYVYLKRTLLEDLKIWGPASLPVLEGNASLLRTVIVYISLKLSSLAASVPRDS